MGMHHTHEFSSADLHQTEASRPRRHDFDALRAIAMLLGIALHAGLAFVPFPWFAMNKEVSPAIGIFIEVLHGFRLPVFFLMSGFFSAMLLERRGIRGFLTHRWRRIAIPLMLGMVTIIPAMWGVIIGGHAMQRVFPPPARERAVSDGDGRTLSRAAADGDLDEVRALVAGGAAVDAPDAQFFTLPLAWAATGDHADIVEFLLDSGADPNQRMGDDNTPMHTACFFGAAESASLLIGAGGDPDLPNKHGETPLGAMKHDANVVAFIGSLLGVEADFDRVQVGRNKIAEMLDADRSTGGAIERVTDRVRRILAGEVFMHLWFLWYLCWLACGLVIAWALGRALPIRLPDSLISTPACLLGLVPLTAWTQSLQAGFGPDTSAALVPAPQILLHYAVFYGFGVLMHRSPSAADRLGRTWWVYLPVAAACCVVALKLQHNPAFLGGADTSGSVRERCNALMQSAFVSATAFGLLGLSRRVLSRPSPRLRFIADSSYWLYVAHLPVVIAGQFVLAYFPMNPIVKCGILAAATTGLLLLSYRLFVRSTWIGVLLNGPQVRMSSVRGNVVP